VSRIVKYNHEWFLSRLKERRPEEYKEYKFIEEYTKSTTRIKAVHLPCGEEVDILPNGLISRGSGCYKCNKKRATETQRKSHEQFISELPNNITALERYNGAYNKIKVSCSDCGEVYNIRPHDLNRRGCTRCLGRHERTLTEVKEEILTLSKGEYEVVSDSFINTHTAINIRHRECGNIYQATRHNFRKGRRCPICRSSIGETLTEQALQELEVNYERQKTFNDLYIIGKLSYDFYLPEYKLLIEYQGIQHYEPVEHFGGEEQFTTQKERDRRKREYAKLRGIDILEIPYTIRTLDGVKEKIKSKLVSVTH